MEDVVGRTVPDREPVMVGVAAHSGRAPGFVGDPEGRYRRPPLGCDS